jgi:hypothetical protein
MFLTKNERNTMGSLIDLDMNVGDDFFEPRSFDPAPAGVYLFSVCGKRGAYPIEITESKDSHLPMVAVELHIEASPKGEETPHKGKVLFENFVLKDKDSKKNEISLKMLTHMLLSFGATTEEEVRNKTPLDISRLSPTSRGLAEIYVKSETDQAGNAQQRNHVRNFFWKPEQIK